MMLHLLDAIDWSNLRTMKGTANDIPKLLHAFIDASDEAAVDKFLTLSELLSHQGTVYSAGVALIPFLVELLPSVSSDKQLLLLELMLIISEYHGQKVEVVDNNDGLETTSLSLKAQRELVKYHQSIMNYLQNEDPRIRRQTIYLLGSISQFSEAEAEVIGEKFLSIMDDKDHVEAWIIDLVGEFLDNYPKQLISQHARYFEKISMLCNSLNIAVSLFASLKYIRLIHGKGVPVYVLEKVVNAAKGYYNLHLNYDATLSAIDALAQIPLEQYIPIMCAVIQEQKSEPIFKLRFIVVPFLDRVFDVQQKRSQPQRAGWSNRTLTGSLYFQFPQSTEKREIEMLNDSQKKALRFIVLYDELWEIPHNLLEMYGFFIDKETLQHQLESLEDHNGF